MNTKVATWDWSIGSESALDTGSTTALGVGNGLGSAGRQLSILLAGLASLRTRVVGVGELHGSILITGDEHVADRESIGAGTARE